MNRIKVEKSKDYTVISNVFLRDRSLSLKAKGLLAVVMALSDGWDFSISGFSKITKEGEAAIYSAIKELKDAGYCKEGKIRDANKRIIGNEYTFCETPVVQSAENQLNRENQDLGFLNQGNQVQLNTNNNIENNKVLNNKEEDIIISSKKNDYQAIIDCWNESNGKRLGKVTKITPRRKQAIKKALEDNGIEQETLMALFKALPHADNWLYNPNGSHKNWKPDFDWWMANTNGWLTKALEGKVHKENPQIFSLIMNGEDCEYTPQGFKVWYDEQTKMFWTGEYMYDGRIHDDGYTDENRPDGAKLVLNNARGTIIWDKETKEWKKQ